MSVHPSLPLVHKPVPEARGGNAAGTRSLQGEHLGVAGVQRITVRRPSTNTRPQPAFAPHPNHGPEPPPRPLPVPETGTSQLLSAAAGRHCAGDQPGRGSRAAGGPAASGTRGTDEPGGPPRSAPPAPPAPQPRPAEGFALAGQQRRTLRPDPRTSPRLRRRGASPPAGRAEAGPQPGPPPRRPPRRHPAAAALPRLTPPPQTHTPGLGEDTLAGREAPARRAPANLAHPTQASRQAERGAARAAQRRPQTAPPRPPVTRRDPPHPPPPGHRESAEASRRHRAPSGRS